MTAAERDLTRAEGFNLGVRALQRAHGIEIPGTDAGKLWDLLEEIASGRETIVSDPATLLRRLPQAPADVRDGLWDSVNALVARDRAIARSILDDLARLTREL